MVYQQYVIGLTQTDKNLKKVSGHNGRNVEIKTIKEEDTYLNVNNVVSLTFY